MNRFMSAPSTAQAAVVASKLILLSAIAVAEPSLAQTPPSREVRAGTLTGEVVIDGVFDEAAWQSADIPQEFTQSDPTEGARPSGITRVRVLAARDSEYGLRGNRS
jgi:hypothetical protein